MNTKIYQSIKTTLLCAFTLFWVLNASGQGRQGRRVSGQVTGQDGAIPGANVVLKGSTIGTTTDADGNYSLALKSDRDVIIISAIGYKSKEVVVGNQSTINASLDEEASTLNEVVVTGYTAEQKKDILGSVAIVKAQELLQTPTGNVTSQLQGRSAGVTVISDGTPGGAAKVRIRGVGSFGVNGSNPLYIIDGVPATSNDAVNNINPNDVESFQVLKDAAAASVYGARGSNGVIIITTKKGKAGTAKISVDAYYGINYVSSKDFPALLNTQQYGQLIWAQAIGAGQTPTHAQYGSGPTPVVPEYVKAGTFSGAQLEALRNTNPAAFAAAVDPALYNFQTYQIVKAGDTNWFDEVFNPAPVKNVQLNASGGSEKGTYSISMSYFGQDNTLNKYGFYNRFTARANSSLNIKKNFHIGENLQVTYTQSRGGGGSSSGSSTGSSSAWQMLPFSPVYDIMGMPVGGNVPATGTASPIAINWRNRFDKTGTIGVFGNVFADVTFLKNFTARTSFGVDFGSADDWDITMRTYENAQNTATNSLNRSQNWSTTWTWTNTLNYSKQFQKHSFKALVGSEAIRQYADDVVGNVQDYDIIEDPNFVTLNTGTGLRNTTGSFNRETLASLFGRVDYSFADKYLFNATIRRDGSSKFGINNRYGIFPAAGVGWRLSSEKFMQGIGWLNDLKVRASYGVIGNQNGLNAANQYQQYLKRPRDGYPMSGGNVVSTGFSVGQIGNPDARWEKNVTTNFGLDASLFDNTLDFTLEYYVKETKDLLVQNQAPTTGSNATQPFINVGNMVNKGIDFNVTKRGTISNGLKYEVSANFSRYKNEVLKVLDNPQSFLAGTNAPGIGILSRTQAGYPISYLWGYKVDGFFNTQEEVNKYIADGYTSWITPKLGRWRIQDINGDKIIDERDRVQTGSPHPDFQVGFNLALSYRNFDFTGFLFWNQGGQVFNLSRRNTDFNRFVLNRSQRMLYQSWTPGADNSGALLPKLDASDSQTPSQGSDYFVEDVTYVRLKTLQLGYTLPKGVISRIGVDRLRFYVQAQNLFTARGGKKPFTGLDPGTALAGTNDLGLGAVDDQNPTPKQFLIGLNLNF